MPPPKIGRLITLPTKSDDRGDLVFLEAQRQLPFSIQRLFYILNVKAERPRGFHAHKKNWLALICLSGSVLVKLDDGLNADTVVLNLPNHVLVIPPKIWHSLEHFTPGTIVLACASEPYDENDYIRDYQKFIQYVSSK